MDRSRWFGILLVDLDRAALERITDKLMPYQPIAGGGSIVDHVDSKFTQLGATP